MLFHDQQRQLYNYCEEHSTHHSALLAELYRETNIKTLKPRMASGPLQGRFLAAIAMMKKPQHILEVGTFTGYATLCMAEGLADNGQITTLEVNPELAYISNKYFQKSAWSSQIKPIVGDALEILSSIENAIDMVFIDAKKRDYIRYYDLIIDKVKSGGLILADNILWDGKVMNESPDRTTRAIKEFNSYVAQDQRVHNVIFPLRDGVNIIMKR